MTDYKRMYAMMCGAVSDVLDILPDREENSSARVLLQRAMLQSERIYIDTVEELPEEISWLQVR